MNPVDQFEEIVRQLYEPDKTKSEVSDREGHWDLSLTLASGRTPALSF